MLGRLIDSWFERGALVGKFKLNATPEGKKAEGMGRARRDHRHQRRLSRRGLGFTATRWQLFEASLVGVPADASAAVRSMMSRGRAPVADIRARMRARQRIVMRRRRHG
jgi:hypothetical protein